MAEFISLRASHDGSLAETMPPIGGLNSYQKETLENWFKSAPILGQPAERGSRVNAPPKFETINVVSQNDATTTIAYEISDADFDIVAGTAVDQNGQLVASVSDGKASFKVSSRVTSLDVTISDGFDTVQENLGIDTFTGDLTPDIAISGVSPYDLIAASTPLDVTIQNETPVDLEVTLVKGEDSVPVLATQGATGTVSLSVAPSLVSGPGWTLQTKATDASAASVKAIGPLVFGDGQTTESFDTIGPILIARCASCHAGGRIPNLSFDVTTYASLAPFMGLVYERVVVQQTMPPLSTQLTQEGQLLTEQEIEKVANWILAGAPE